MARIVPLRAPTERVGDSAHPDRDADISRTGEEIRAKFLRDNAVPDAPYRDRLLTLAATDGELSDGAFRQLYIRVAYSDRKTGLNSYPSKETLAALIDRPVRRVHVYDAELVALRYQSAQRRRNLPSLVTMLSPTSVARIISEVTGIALSEVSESDVSENDKCRNSTLLDGQVVSRVSKNSTSETRHKSRSVDLSHPGSDSFDTLPCSTYPIAEQAENPSKITTVESSAALSRGSACEAEEAAPRDSVSTSRTSTASPSREPMLVETRKVAKAAIAKHLNGARQPDMLKAADLTGTAVTASPEIVQQVIQAFTVWFDAMGDLWKGARISKAQKRAMRQLIEDEGFDYVLALGGALQRLQFGKGQASGWVVELRDLLFDEEKRAKVFGQYQRPPLVRAAPASPIGAARASPIDEAIAAGADERIVRKLGRTLLTIKAGADAKGREVDWLIGLSETLADLGEIPDDMLDWAAKDMRNACPWRPEISTIRSGFKVRLAELASWRRDEKFLAKIDAAWAEEQKNHTYFGWESVGKPLAEHVYGYQKGAVYTEDRLFQDWLHNETRNGNYSDRYSCFADSLNQLAELRRSHEVSFDATSQYQNYWEETKKTPADADDIARRKRNAGVL